MEPDLDPDHINHINGLCRVCGKQIKSKNYPVSCYKDEINHVFKTLVSDDLPNVHPTRLCQSCRIFLFKIRKSK